MENEEKMPVPDPRDARIAELEAALREAPHDAAGVESTLASVSRDDAERTIERLHGPVKLDLLDEALERAETKAWNVVMFLDGVHRHKLIENYSSDYARLQEARTDAAELLAAIRAARGLNERTTEGQMP